MADSNQPQQADNDKWLIAWVLLLLLLGRSAARGFTPTQQQRVRQLLRDKYNNDAVRLAAAIVGGAITLDEWQAQLSEAGGDYARQMAVAGAGTLPGIMTQAAIDSQLENQQPYLAGFAAAIAAGGLSVAAIIARSKLYGGVGWAAYWQGADSVQTNNVVVYYVARDDDRTCARCLEAERNGPYRAGTNHPFPGDVCLGGGHCRCELRYEVNAELWARLR